MFSGFNGPSQGGSTHLIRAVIGTALLLASWACGGTAAEAKNAKFMLIMDYFCVGENGMGCNGLTQETTWASFYADDHAVTDLTTVMGKHILGDFYIFNTRVAADQTSFTCDKGDVSFDPSAVFLPGGGTTYADGFSCTTLTVQGASNSLTLTITGLKHTGGLTGTLLGNDNRGHLLTFGTVEILPAGLVIRNFNADSTNPLTALNRIQNRWNSCQFSGFKSLGPVVGNSTDGCQVEYDQKLGRWLLYSQRNDNAGPNLTCSAICETSSQ